MNDETLFKALMNAHNRLRDARRQLIFPYETAEASKQVQDSLSEQEPHQKP